MEYVRVVFSVKRDVYIDDKNAGQTHEKLRVRTGTHKFYLGGPKNFRPGEIIKKIEETSEFKPEVITFEEVPNDNE